VPGLTARSYWSSRWPSTHP